MRAPVWRRDTLRALHPAVLRRSGELPNCELLIATALLTLCLLVCGLRKVEGAVGSAAA